MFWDDLTSKSDKRFNCSLTKVVLHQDLTIAFFLISTSLPWRVEGRTPTWTWPRSRGRHPRGLADCHCRKLWNILPAGTNKRNIYISNSKNNLRESTLKIQSHTISFNHVEICELLYERLYVLRLYYQCEKMLDHSQEIVIQFFQLPHYKRTSSMPPGSLVGR